MRRLVLVVILVVAMSVSYDIFLSEDSGTGALTLDQPWPTPGEKAPSFEAERVSGQEFSMPDDGTYVVSFWSGLNRSSYETHSSFERLAREYGSSEVSFAAVYVGSVPRRDRSDAPYAVIKDKSGQLTSMYNVKRVPRLFLVKDGTVRLAQDNFYGENVQDMRQALDSTLQANN